MGKNREKKDIAEKEFVSFPDITADIINVLLYQGRGIVDARNLRAGPTEYIYQGGKKLRNEYEDLCKYEFKDGRVKMMYLIANQSRVDGKMLLRKAGYTGGAYREQYEKKIQDTYPVVEFVLYWGKSGWRRGRNIQQLFRKKNFESEEWKYIDELKLHVFEMRHLPEETRKLFQSDMRIVADFLAEGDSYRSDRKVVHKAALIRMIKVLSGENDTENIEEWMEEQEIKEEDEITVCELFDQYVRQGRQEGEIWGEEKGKARQLVKDVENAMRFFQVTLEKACEGLGITVDRYNEAKSI